MHLEKSMISNMICGTVDFSSDGFGYYLPEDLNLLEDNISLVLRVVLLNCTLLNFSEKDLFFSIFENYGNDFEYRYNGVFRRTQPPLCPDCGSGMHSKIDDFRCLEHSVFGGIIMVITLIQRKIWAVLKLAGISAHYVVNHMKRVVSSGRR